jgi:DNA-binding transcriptional ArsR family regulator
MPAPRRRATADALTALGDPRRRTIVELLRGGPLSVGEIAQRMPISRPAVSRHLRLLKAAALVVDERRATRRLYRLEPAGAEAVGLYLQLVWGQAAARFALYAANAARPPRRGPGRPA